MLDFLKKDAPAEVEAPPETVETVTDELHRCQDELSAVGQEIQEYRQSQPDLKVFHIDFVTRLEEAKRHPRLRELQGAQSKILQRHHALQHRRKELIELELGHPV